MLIKQQLIELFKPNRLIVADALELAIKETLWDPDKSTYLDSGKNSYMCLAIAEVQRQGLITLKAYRLTRQFIMKTLYPAFTYENYFERLNPRLYGNLSAENMQRSRIAWFYGRIYHLQAGT